MYAPIYKNASAFWEEIPRPFAKTRAGDSLVQILQTLLYSLREFTARAAFNKLSG